MPNQSAARSLTVLLACILCSVASMSAVDSRHHDEGLTTDDVNAIKKTIEAYRTAWLEGSAEGVLKTFADDAILLPHHGDRPVRGIAAIREYWFAARGPKTAVTELKISVEDVSGNGNMAFAYGQDAVYWTITRDGQPQRFSNAGTYLNVMKKLRDGSWRIQAHMWDDPINQAQ